MADSVMLRGEGGALIRCSLPLRGAYADQFAQGKLVAADDQSRAALAVPDEAPQEPDPQSVPPKVGPGSSRDAWAAYAESQGIDTSGMGRAEIIAAVEGE